MALLNTPAAYGSLTKALHWAVAALFAFQLVSAPAMLTLGDQGALAGLSRDDWFNWHKTIGLVALGLAMARIAARRAGTLPDWAPVLSDTERRVIHRAEQALYAAMILMPVSGYLYCMAGGYGVTFAGAYPLPNLVGEQATLAEAAKWLHLGTAILLVAALGAHLGVVLRHTVLLGDGLIRRMLPGKH